MKIVITGSIGNIGKPLTQQLVHRGHDVTVITSKAAKQADIALLQAKAAVGTFFDVDFLSETFAGADIVYLMEAWEGIGSVFDKDKDFVAAFDRIGNNYKTAVERAGVKRVVHLSSIGAHTDQGVGSLAMHHTVENILGQLPGDVSIKFIRPVGFYTNLYRWIHSINTQNAIVQTYGGDQKEPWVSPVDIADAIVEEMEKPFEGRTVRYVASDEISPLELATVLGQAIGQPDLKWVVISEEAMLGNMRALGMNEWIAQGFIAMQAAQGTGALYEDFYRHKPTLGSVKLKDFATEFAKVYHHQTKAAV
jgi:uncharacterized protein YbjT (DUF2867 family)